MVFNNSFKFPLSAYLQHMEVSPTIIYNYVVVAAFRVTVINDVYTSPAKENMEVATLRETFN